MSIEVVKPSAEVISRLEYDEMMAFLEKCGRTCYKSEDRITLGSAERFVEKICKNNHESVLEHASVTVRFICSRACSHQLVRHRIGAYSQESQRYVNYNKKGYQVICPPSVGIPAGRYTHWHYYGDLSHQQNDWLSGVGYAFAAYEKAMKEGLKPEDARFFLPNACKTEIVATYNLRMWRHVFRERALNPHAQWEIKSLMTGLLREFRSTLPVVFGDLQ